MRRLLLLSLVSTVAVALWAAAEKARIDARARWLAAESRHRSAGADATAAPDLRLAGEAYLELLRTPVPFDPTAARAAGGVAAVARELARRGDVGPALRLLDDADRAIAAATLLTWPLAAESADLEAVRESLSAGGRPRGTPPSQSPP